MTYNAISLIVFSLLDRNDKPTFYHWKIFLTEKRLRPSKYLNNQQMYFNVYDVFYSLNSHQHVSAGIPAIFKVMVLQDYKRTNFVNCVAVTPQHLKS
jgi:hypothetical protein